MDALLLALALLSLAATFNALWPRYAPPRRALASFALGFLVNEAPIHHLLAQVAVAALLLHYGAAGTITGLAGTAVFVVSWCGLVGVAARARLVVPAVARGLTEVRTGLPHLSGAESAQAALLDAAGQTDPGNPEHARETSGSQALERVVTGVPATREKTLANETAISREVIDDLDPSGLPSLPVWWVRFPFPLKPRRVVRQRDIVFARPDGIPLRLDIYHLETKPEGAPVLVYVHGGAWILGSRREQGLPLIHRMALDGWVVVAVDYRLSPRATFPDHLEDLKRAMHWIREHITGYGGDPDFVAVAGNSAGGHLAALLALTPNDPRYQPGFEEVDTSVAACVPYYGVHDFTDRFGHWPHRGMWSLIKHKVMKHGIERGRERYEEASPMSRIGKEAPPFLLVHGDHDTLVPVAESRRFQELFRQACPAPIGFIEVPGAQHAFEVFRSVRERTVTAGVARFLEAVHRRWVAARQEGVS